MATNPQLLDPSRSTRAIDCWSPLITYASNRFAIPGRNEPDDLRQEGFIQLTKVLRRYPEWEPDSTDFYKMFKQYLFNRMNDLARLERRECRNVAAEVSLDSPIYLRGDEIAENAIVRSGPGCSRMVVDFEDPRCVCDTPETLVVGHDMFTKVAIELDFDQQKILTLLLYPDARYLQFCTDNSPARLENVQKYLGMTPQEMKFNMQRIQQAASDVQSDYNKESLHSVVHILALPSDRAMVPYWCVWECLDTLSRRLLSLLVFSDIPTSTTLGRLCNLLHQTREQVKAELKKIKTVINRLFIDGVRVPDASRECRVCHQPSKLTCFETGVRGCDKHLSTCKINPKHRVVASMLDTHEHECMLNKLASPRNCQYPGCSVRRYTASCQETGMRGCDEHLETCNINSRHRFFPEQRARHEQWCGKEESIVNQNRRSVGHKA